MLNIMFHISVDGRFGPEVSLNDYIRNEADLRGTKSMCHEGGCGACVVTVRTPLPPSNNMKTFAVNSVRTFNSFIILGKHIFRVPLSDKESL